MSKSAKPYQRRSRPLRTTTLKPRRWPWAVMVAAGVLLLSVVFFLALSQSQPDTVKALGPRLEVDQTSFDYGQVSYNTPIKTVFTLRNTGDAPLRIQEQPQVELVEGC